MSLREFFDDDMRARVERQVAAAEAHTSAEIVVSVHLRSGVYRESYWAAGSLVAFVILLLLLFLPQEFDVRTMPVDVVVGFALGAALAWKVPPVERLFTSRRAMRERVDVAARAELVDGGTTATRERVGVLVYVSALERELRVVFDQGHADAVRAGVLERVEPRLARAVARLDREAFLEALVELGQVLGEHAPRRHDDVDELPNAVRAR